MKACALKYHTLLAVTVVMMNGIVFAEDAAQQTEIVPPDLQGQAQYNPYASTETAPVTFAPPTQAATPAAHDYFTVDHAPGDTGKYSSKKYQAVTYTLKNTQPYHVELLQAEVPNAVDQTSVKQKASKGRMGLKVAGVGLGIASMVVPFAGTASSAAFYAANAGARAASAVGNALAASTPSGNLEISGQFVQKVNNVVMNPEQTFSFTALLPKDEVPGLNLVFKNLETNQVFDLAK